MKIRASILSILWVIVVYLSSTTAQNQYEFTNGPSGEVQVHHVLVQDDYWLAAIGNYLFRTTDEGQNWMMITDGLPEIHISPWTFAKFDGYVYMAANNQSHMLRSSDGGFTWEPYQEGLSSFYRAVKMVVNDGRLFAIPYGSGQLMYLESSEGSWQGTGFSGSIGNGLNVVAGGRLMASIGSTHKYSDDNGNTWIDFPTLPPNSFSSMGATDFVKAGNNVIVTHNSGGGSTTHYSPDDMTTWIQPSPSFSATTTGKEKFVFVNDDHIIGLGLSVIMKSTDQGESWQEATNPESRFFGNAGFIQALSGNRVLVGTNLGLFIYEDWGEGERTTVSLPIGNPAVEYTRIFNGQMYMLESAILHRYNEQQNSWSKAVDFRDLGASLGPANISVTGDRMFVVVNSKVFTSTNGIDFEEIEGVSSFLPLSFYSIGNRWIIIGGTRAGIFWNGVVFKYSDDEGQTWSDSEHNFNLGGFPNRLDPHFTGFEVVHHNGDVFISGTYGILRSSDNGLSWHHERFESSHIMFSMGNALFKIRTNGSSVRRSTDNGSTWQTYMDGIPATNAFTRATKGLAMLDGVLYTYNDPTAFVPADEGELGLFALTNPNGEWEYQLNHPKTPFIPRGLYSFNNRLYAGWEGVGFFRSPSFGQDTSIENPDEIPSNFMLSQNYPNPFNPTTTIQFEMTTPATIKLEVYNIAGQRVHIYTPGRLNQGVHYYVFDASGLSSGMYLYRLTAENTVVATRKMVLVK